MSNINLIELKSIEHHDSMSEETYCYNGTIYINGAPWAYVKNDGRGGCDMVRPFDPQGYKGFEARRDEVENHIAITQPSPFDIDDVPQLATLETWCANQVTLHIHRQEMKKAFGTKMVFKAGGKRVSYIPKQSQGRKWADSDLISHIKNKYPAAKILNIMPEGEALELWCAQ